MLAVGRVSTFNVKGAVVGRIDVIVGRNGGVVLESGTAVARIGIFVRRIGGNDGPMPMFGFDGKGARVAMTGSDVRIIGAFGANSYEGVAGAKGSPPVGE